MLAGCLLLGFALILEKPAESSPLSLLEQARLLKDRAERARSQGHSTVADYRALAGVLSELRHRGFGTADLCLNEGNASFLAGDWSHALLAYCLAQQAAPARSDVQLRIDEARTRLGMVSEPEPALATALGLLGTENRLRAVMWTITWLLYAAGCWQISRTGSRFQAPALLLGLGLFMGAGACAAALVGTSIRQDRLSEFPLVVAKGKPVSLREGNGLAYEAVNAEPLEAGREARLLNRRGNWLQVKLADGAVGWLSAGSAEVE